MSTQFIAAVGVVRTDHGWDECVAMIRTERPRCVVAVVVTHLSTADRG